MFKNTFFIPRNIFYWHYFLPSRSQPMFPKGNRLQLFGRAVLGTCGHTISYCAIRHMPLGDLSMISSTSIFFVCLSAWLFLKEPIDKLTIINIMFVLGGLLMIVQPPFIFTNEEQIYSENPKALYSAIAVICSAVLVQSNVIVILRSLKGKSVKNHTNKIVHHVIF